MIGDSFAPWVVAVTSFAQSPESKSTRSAIRAPPKRLHYFFFADAFFAGAFLAGALSAVFGLHAMDLILLSTAILPDRASGGQGLFRCNFIPAAAARPPPPPAARAA